MSRFIDRAELFNRLSDVKTLAAAMVVIQDMPAAEVVEVVRCKGCAHYNAGFECLIEGYGIERDPHWFCADAERKTDG